MDKNKTYIIILVSFISLFLIQSYIPIIIETIGFSGSSDFQWGPSKCVFNGINHYRAFVNEDKSCVIFMTQFGDYLHTFYIILYPFTLLNWEIAKIFWLLLNLFFLFYIIYLISKKLIFNVFEKIITFFFIFFCITTKINFIMGQQALFTLFFLLLPFFKENKKNYFLAGLCYLKYNIGYALFLYLFISRKIKYLLISILPVIFGWIIYADITNTPILTNLIDPILLLLKNFKILNELNHIFIGSIFINLTDNYYLNIIIILIFILIFNLFFLIKISNIQNDIEKLSLISVLILISFPHWSHDYIILIPLFMISLKNFSSNMIYKFNFLISVYFLHLHKVVLNYTAKVFEILNFNENSVIILGNIYPYLNIFLLMACLVMNLWSDKLNKFSNKI